ncbi:MAG TPA: hypothetical protein PKB02_04665 [Anaerohalosphaeraceae bacterium]|nr:hypothetical protein [Anaerohalosphaeraceae bacterium]
MHKLRFSLVLGLWSCLIVSTQAATYGGGSGTQEDPYQIRTAEQMNTIGANPADWNKCFKLMNDIDMSIYTGTQYNIIGNSTTGFSGTFDGDHHKINKLSITGTSQKYVGIFGCIGFAGHIKNLGIVNLDIQGDDYVGGLCGGNYGIIHKSYVAGMVTGNYYSGGLCGYNSGTIRQSCAKTFVKGGDCVGGLCGYNYKGTISQTYATNSVMGESWIGGLCGFNYSGTINQSYATSSVVGGDKSVGGLCAYNSGVITDSYWDTNSSGQAGGAGGWRLTSVQMKQAASFAGWNDGTWAIEEGTSTPHLLWENTSGNLITTNYVARTYMGSGTADDPYQIANAKDLLCLGHRTLDWNSQYILVDNIDLSEVNFTQAVIAGGGGMFTGTFNGNSHVIAHLNINNPEQGLVGLFGQISSSGQVKKLRLINVNIIGRDNAGGLCGYNGGTINQCYVTGIVTGHFVCLGGLCGSNSGNIVQSCAIGVVTGNWSIGGLCGDNYGTISQSWAMGSGVGNLWIGGLCGSNLGIISQSYSTDTVTGSDYVGGLCGGNYCGTINHSYATGITIGNYFVGGLCGDMSSGTIINCFWNIETSGQSIGVGYGLSTGVTGKTTAEMMTRSTFTDAGWDFDADDGDTADWMMLRPGEDYPRLKWQTVYPGDIAGLYGVDMADFAELAEHWLNLNCPADCEEADIDLSGSVDMADLILLSRDWMP